MKTLAMKRLSLLALAALMMFGAAACDDSPTEPEDNNTVVFTASMTAAQETTAVTGAEAAATGTATITFNLTRDTAGTITAGTANFTATVSNMPQGSTLILAHIHTGVAGVSGGVLVNTGLSAATGIAIGANGTGTLTFNNVALTVDQINNIIANPAGFYFNVHSTLHPSGVVRGQLVRQN
jgi:hypothetical protein